MKEYKAQAKFVRLSAQKARIPANIIRGMNAIEAVSVLEYIPKKAAKEIKKVLESAIANAKYASAENIETLIISRITIDEASTYRRFKPGGRGSYKPFKRPTSHITIILGERAEKKEEKETVQKEEEPTKKNSKKIKEEQKEKKAKVVTKPKKDAKVSKTVK